jgi:hypothetical protein
MSGLPPPPLMSVDEQARRARELLADPLLTQAFIEITESAIGAWRASDNPGQREQQWHMVRAIGELQRVLEGKLTDARMMERRERRLREG